MTVQLFSLEYIRQVTFPLIFPQRQISCLKIVTVFGDFYLYGFCCCHQRGKFFINFKPEADSDKKAGEYHEPHQDNGIAQEQGDQTENPQVKK